MAREVGRKTIEEPEPGRVRDVACVRLDSEVPALVMRAGNAARFAYEEFIYGKIRNPYTRKNYRHAIHRFLDWSIARGLELEQVAPKDVGQYLDGLELGPATKKLHLSALRHFFDETLQLQIFGTSTSFVIWKTRSI